VRLGDVGAGKVKGDSREDILGGPLDHQWRSYLVGSGGPTWERVYFPAGSICAAFEGGGETFEIDSLMTPKFRKEQFKNSWIL
jgi:hypothetical protein